MQYLEVFKYLVQYLVFKYYLNTAQSEVFHKVFKYSGQSIRPKTAVHMVCVHNCRTQYSTEQFWLFSLLTPDGAHMLSIGGDGLKKEKKHAKI